MVNIDVDFDTVYKCIKKRILFNDLETIQLVVTYINLIKFVLLH